MLYAKNCSPWNSALQTQLPLGSITPDGAEQDIDTGWQLSTVTTHSLPARARIRKFDS